MFLLSDIKQTRVYQEAREQGIEQGIEQGKKQVALNLLNTGMSIAQVSKVTGFTVEQLQQLQ